MSGTGRAVRAATGRAVRALRGGTARRRVLVAGTGAVVVSLAIMVMATGSPPPPDESASQWLQVGPTSTPDPPPPHRPLIPMAVPVQASPTPDRAPPPPPRDAFTAWAIMDTVTGQVTGSDNMAATSTTASMIKAWLVADYLRLTSEQGEEPEPERLHELSLIIRDSDNEHTQMLFEEIGSHASIERLISVCGLTDSSAVPWFWSNTRLSPRDTARMGACIGDGRAAGQQWTDWLLDEMRAVRGVGDFGIRHAFPEDQRSGIAIKNGWVIRSDAGEYHVNCLAIGDGWTMGVLTRYPASLGYLHGAELCRSLAAEHLLAG